MNERAMRTLEYHKIIERLATFAGSVRGKELCTRLLPETELARVQQAQRETADALARLFQKGSLSFSGIPDIRDSLARLAVEASLSAAELLRIGSVLTAALRAKNYGNTKVEKSVSHQPAWKQEQLRAKEKTAETAMSEEEAEEETDSLSAYFALLEPLSGLNNEIRRCILSEEEVADDASPALARVRRAIRLANDKIKEQLGAMLNGASTRGMLQDALITMRNGRYCLPVRSEFKNQMAGMVHDQSASGSTVFIEPMAVVKLNNELRELAIKEKEEVEAVLAELSGQAAVHTEALRANVETLAQLDFIFARAALARQMKASEPQLNDKGYLHIKKGRHPLIDAQRVVPITVYIGRDFHLLVITGPNTGGKTVTLKTVGLFTLMAQAGLHIPAAEGSELAVFGAVYADIGDEQSIEQSLSTFSSHMTNTVSILKEAEENSLVLFDELGAGTDPTEGAALAMAILLHLHRRGIRTIATTHYSELKVFALETEGVTNACCEFDVETLRPTYRLLIGVPGKSNAFAISAKLGLPELVIQEAKGLIGTQAKSFEDLLADLDAQRVRMEAERAETEMLKQEAEALKKRLAEKNARIDEARDKILRRANEEARDILQQAKETADEAIRTMQKLGQSGRELEQERGTLRELLAEKDRQLGVKAKPKKRTVEVAPDALRVGDTVLVLSLNLKGTVATLPNAKNELYVQLGAMRTLVKLKDVEPCAPEVEEEAEKKKSGGGQINLSKAMSVRTELNLIGKRVDEALPELDKYLDDAYLSHLPQVTIIHGRGTGALKEAVHAHLKRTKYVKSYRIGGFGEGDHGVTIVEFK